MKTVKIKAVVVGEKIPSLKGEKGKTLSIFRNTVNVHVKNELITITAKSISSPNNVNLDLIEFLKHVTDFRNKLVPEDTIYVFNEYISFQKSRLLIHTSGSRIFSVKDELRKLRKKCRGINTNELRAASKEFLRIAAIINKEISTEFLPEIIDSSLSIYEVLLNSSKPRVYLPKEALKHLGLGDGLTPAYDDFLGGLLGTLNPLLSLKGSRRILVFRGNSLNKTTLISKYLLASLFKGEANNLILNVLNTYCMNKHEALLDKLIDLLQLGHSSGTYLGVGSIIALLIDSMLLKETPPPISTARYIIEDVLSNY